MSLTMLMGSAALSYRQAVNVVNDLKKSARDAGGRWEGESGVGVIIVRAARYQPSNPYKARRWRYEIQEPGAESLLSQADIIRALRGYSPHPHARKRHGSRA